MDSLDLRLYELRRRAAANAQKVPRIGEQSGTPGSATVADEMREAIEARTHNAVRVADDMYSRNAFLPLMPAGLTADQRTMLEVADGMRAQALERERKSRSVR